MNQKMLIWETKRRRQGKEWLIKKVSHYLIEISLIVECLSSKYQFGKLTFVNNLFRHLQIPKGTLTHYVDIPITVCNRSIQVKLLMWTLYNL